jgi:DNA-binding MarR family transcriptional regulator
MSQVLSPQQIPPAVRAWTRLLRAYASTTRQLSVELQDEHGLTLNDYEALYVLSGASGRRMKRVDLARRLMLTPSGVTRMLEGLEGAGLVERAACDSDLRVTYAQLTEAGAAKVEAASCGHEGSIRTLLGEHFTETELETLAGLLGKLPGVAEGDDSCAAA